MNITKKLAQIFTGTGALCTLVTGKAMATSLIQENVDAVQVEGLPTDLLVVANQISSVALGVIAIVSIIMLIYGGVRYIISGGDSKKVTDAKNTVLYAIIGLVISFLAFAIVNFVISALPSSDKKTDDKTETSLILPTHC